MLCNKSKKKNFISGVFCPSSGQPPNGWKDREAAADPGPEAGEGGVHGGPHRDHGRGDEEEEPAAATLHSPRRNWSFDVRFDGREQSKFEFFFLSKLKSRTYDSRNFKLGS